MKTLVINPIFFVFSLLLFFSSCSNSFEGSNVIINDKCNILSSETEHKLQNMDFRVKNTVIVTLDSINIKNISTEINKQFESYDYLENFASHGILILTIKKTNISVIKFGDSFDGVGLLPVDYGSRRYYRVQCDDKLSSEEKTLAMADLAVEASHNYSDLVNVVKGELLGNLFNVVEPSDSFIYRFLIKPFQYPVILLIRVTDNFFISLLIWALVLLAIEVLITKYSIARKFSFLHLKPGQVEFNKAKVTLFFNIVSLLLWDLPIIIGCMGLASNFAQVGFEKVFVYAEHIGLSPQTVSSIFLSGGSNFSYFISFISFMMVMFAYYKHTESKITLFKYGAWGFLCCFSPIYVVVTILIYHLPLVYFNYRTLKSNIYDRSRKAGLGHVESFFYTIIGPISFALLSVVSIATVNYFTHQDIKYTSTINNYSINKISHSRINQLFPLNGTKDSDGSTERDLSNISHLVEIIEPLHLESTYTEEGIFKYKIYKMKINSTRKLTNVPLIFKGSYDKYNEEYAEWVDIIKKGESELTFKVYTPKRNLHEFLRVGVIDSSLSKYIIINKDNELENTADFTIGLRYSYKYKNRNVEGIVLLSSKSRLILKNHKDIEFIEFFR